MRSLSFRLLSFVVVVLLVPVAFAHDVTISGTTSFAALDGSANDHDGVANGVFTVSDGNLTVNGVVNCNDDGASANACPMSFVVSGNMTMNTGGALYAENRTGSGIGGAITLTVGGNLAMNGNAIISTASKSSSGSTGGAIGATVSGNVALASGTTIDSGSSNAAGGNIAITAAGLVSVDGNVLSGPSRTLLSTRLTGGAALDGGTSNNVGGAISIGSNTFAEPAVSIGTNANIISQGADSGAGPVTISGCGIEVRGLVAALSKKDGAASVRIYSGKDVLIDGRDLGGSGTRMGRVRADAPTGTAVNKGIDVIAAETVDIKGPTSGTMYVLTSLPGIHDSKSYGGLIRIMSTGDTVNGSGRIIDDGHTASGDTGGPVQISAKGNINLDTAVIDDVGDFNTNNSNRGGGSVNIRSYSGNVSWQNGSGDVRPVGSTSGLAPADQGKIIINACGTINTTGSSFPVQGVPTGVFPETHTGVCSPAAPSLPVGTPPLVTCNTPPVANDASASTNEDTTVTITLSGTDADGDSLTFSIVSGPFHGSLGAIVPTGPTSATVDYTPSLNYNGSDSFVYRANDGNGGTDDATVTITITPVNDPPTFLAGPTVTVLEDSGPQTYAGWASSITAGPADESSQTVTFTVTNDNPSLFSVQPAVASNGTLTFTPAANAYGSANITVTAHDNGGTLNGGNDTSAPQSSSITVTPVNDEPSFTGGGNVSVLEDSGSYSAAWASAISPGPNESGQTVAFVVANNNNALFASQPAISPSGVLTFTLAANANGSATVTVYLQDNGGTANGGDDTSPSQTFTITVTAVNDAPSFTSGGNVTVNEDSAAYSAAWATAISAGPADESSQTLTFNVTGNSNPSIFSVAPSIAADGTLSFTLASNAFGTSTITVTLSDSGGIANGGVDTSAPQSFDIIVNNVNDEPTFTSGGNVTVNEDSGAYSAAWATAISAGPNESGQTLTFHTSNDNNALFASQPSIDASGNLTFTPAANANGSATVTVYLTDDGGIANGGDDTSPSVTFTITVDPVNDAPSFVSGGDVTVDEDSGAYSAAWATSISAGPANESSQTVSFVVTANSNAALFAVAPSVSSTGVLSFTLNANVNGSATITLHAQDDGGIANGGVDVSPNVNFTINVQSVNDAPSFTSGGDVNVNEDSGLYSATWATAISAGPNEGGQTVTFFTSNNNNALFSVQPSINAAGVLTFTPAPNAFGSATVSVYLQDNGGTANSGVDTSATVNFTITVNGVNDPPTAGNDSWETEGNTELRVDHGSNTTPYVGDTTPSTTGVLDNDADNVEGDPFAITSVVGCPDTTAPFVCSVTGGNLVLEANGSFTFQPSPGATSASFQYVVTDMPSAGVPASATGSVTITIHDMIWYVNGSGPAGNGTSSSPFNNFTPLNGVGDVDSPGDYIFVHNSSVNGSISLETNERLWGEGIGLIIPRNLNGNGSPATLVAPGPRGKIFGGAADAVVANGVTGVEIAGLEINSVSGNGIRVASPLLGAAASATIYNNVVTGAGLKGIVVNGFSSAGCAVSIDNTPVTSTGNGVDVVGSDGTNVFSYTNGTITSSSGKGLIADGTGAGILVVTGLSNVTVSGSTPGDGISITAARFDANAGTAAFDTVNAGAIAVGSSVDPVGAAAFTASNVSGDLAFTSLNAYGSTNGVSIGGTGLFTGAAGMRVTSLGGNASANAGVGVSVTNATIGAANLSFTSVNAAGGVNGILLNNTGSVGGLKVLGTGSANTGGHIHNAQVGARLTSTANTSLAWMHFNDFSDFGIRGSQVNGFSLANSTIDGTNGDSDAADEGSISFSELTGSASISNCSISGAVEDNVRVLNSTGTLNRLTVSNTTFGSMSSTTGDDAMLIDGSGSAVVNVTVQNSIFTSARGDHFQYSISGTASGDLVFSGNNITNAHPAVVSGGGGIRVTGGGTGSNVNLTYALSNNVMRDSLGTAIGITKGAGAGTFTGTITGNAVGVAGIADSGSKQGSDISVVHSEGGSSDVTITNNQVFQYGNFGIFLQTGGSAIIGTGSLKAVVQGNTIANPGTLAAVKNGFHLNAGTLPGDTYQVCLTLGGAGALANSMTGSGAGGGTDFRLRQRQSTTVRLPGYAGANNDDTAVSNFVKSNNGGTPSGTVNNTVPTGGGYIGGSC